ncbi:MAG: branched-chain amino acid ABC transporter permease [Oscillospiraceae bacterium]|jgi:branched-chain amino acid transport system permease protein|nr:branched-chain amino acid ABC transporter permease [Oscillospiraceae bacterium]
MSFISYLLNGISLGSIYALIALGYTMVYGIAKMLNFAHGDVIMVGGVIAYTAINSLGLSPYLAVLAAIVTCTVLGITIEKIAYKPLRGASSLTVLITAIGVSYFLQNFVLWQFGSNSKNFPSVVRFPTWQINESLSVDGVTTVTIVTALIIMVALTLFIKKSKPGQAMLALSEDRGAAQLMGVNVNRTVSLTFAIGSALAGVASVLLCSAYPQISYQTGAMPGIKAFVAAVFGGIGSIPGAMIGGVLLGVIENMSKAYISTQMSDAVVFGILILVLLVKPTGILGKKIHEKV